MSAFVTADHRAERDAFLGLALGRRRRSHQARQMARQAEAEGNLRHYRECMADAEEMRRKAWRALELARREADYIEPATTETRTMPLKIVRAQDPITVERLNVVLYAPPGVGKSSLAFTAAAPLLLDFDNGAHRAVNRKDAVRVSEWNEVANITAEDLAPYQTVIVDTAGRALDALTADIIAGDPKMGRGGALSLQGYGKLKTRFTAFMKLLNGFGKDVVLIAHMDEQRSGDDVIERLDVQGGSKNEIYKAADAMGRLVIDGPDRWLRFSPTDAAFGKNPGQLEPLKVPHHTSPEFADFLARVIQTIKGRLNELTEDQRKAVAEQEAFAADLAKAGSADGINALIERAKAGGPVTINLLHKKATEIGLVGDKASGKYVAKPAEKPAEAAKEPEAA